MDDTQELEVNPSSERRNRGRRRFRRAGVMVAVVIALLGAVGVQPASASWGLTYHFNTQAVGASMTCNATSRQLEMQAHSYPESGWASQYVRFDFQLHDSFGRISNYWTAWDLATSSKPARGWTNVWANSSMTTYRLWVRPVYARGNQSVYGSWFVATHYHWSQGWNTWSNMPTNTGSSCQM